MAEASNATNRAKFIPISRGDIIHELLYEARDQRKFNEDQIETFEKLTQILSNLYHFKFHYLSERLLENFSYFCQDNETLIQKFPSQKKYDKSKAELLSLLEEFLVKANYQSFSNQALQELVETVSKKNKGEKALDFNQLDIFKIYTRMNSLSQDSTSIYSRVCLLLRFRGKTQIHLKLFKDVHQDKLEQLFPAQKTNLASTNFSSPTIIFLLFLAFLLLLLFQIIPTNPFSLLTLGVFGFLMFLFSRKLQKKEHSQLLSSHEDLYYSIIDNNFGVIHHLTHSAEEEEFKEILLAYYFLLTQPNHFTPETLNEHICQWLKKTFKVDVDFDIEDGIHKLRETQILFQQSKFLGVVDLQTACTKLNQDWIRLFHRK